MRKCHKCSRTYDDTWGVCLLCGGRLGTTEEGEPVRDETISGHESPDERKKLIIQFSVLLIAATLLLIFILYLTYFGEMARNFLARERQQLESAIISDKNIIK